MTENRDLLARRSRRSAGNEASLIWSLASVVFFLIMHFVARPIFDYAGLGSVLLNLGIGIVLGGIFALIYYRITSPKIRQWQRENNKVMRDKKAKVRDEHLANLKQKTQQSNASVD